MYGYPAGFNHRLHSETDLCCDAISRRCAAHIACQTAGRRRTKYWDASCIRSTFQHLLVKHVFLLLDASNWEFDDDIKTLMNERPHTPLESRLIEDCVLRARRVEQGSQNMTVSMDATIYALLNTHFMSHVFRFATVEHGRTIGRNYPVDQYVHHTKLNESSLDFSAIKGPKSQVGPHVHPPRRLDPSLIWKCDGLHLSTTCGMLWNNPRGWRVSFL